MARMPLHSPAVDVTVLGKSPSWQDADGACSGYLVEDEGVRLLLDCGNGVFAKLRGRRDYDAVDAVLISHLHADHFLHSVPYSYALTYGPRREKAGEPARPVLHAPAGARDTFRRVVGAWGGRGPGGGGSTPGGKGPPTGLPGGPL